MNNRKCIPRRNGLTLGETMACLVSQRALSPGSKMAFSDWSKKTYLPMLYDFDYKKISSSHFWDMMDYVQDVHLQQIEEELVKDIVGKFNLNLDLLLYDYTNFFTFIDTSNEKNSIARRGKNKQKRNDLRQFSLALLVNRECRIPLFSDIYSGNTADAKEFGFTIDKISERLQILSKSIEDMTIVFDKGSNSKENFNNIKEMHYVASFSVSHNKELKNVPFAKFNNIIIKKAEKVGEEDAKLLCYGPITKKIWGTKRTVVMYKSEPLYEGQLLGLHNDLAKFKTEVLKLKKSAVRGTYKKKGKDALWTYELLEMKIEGLINKQFVRDVVDFNIKNISKNKFKITYTVNHNKMNILKERVLGKRILITSRDQWEKEKIIDAYHGQSDVERVFKQLKNPFHNAVRPQYHWTDQKIKVHTFCSILSVTLSNIIEKTARENGFNMTINEIYNRLSEVRKVKYLYPGKRKNKYDIRNELENIENKKTQKLFDLLISA
ncbi:IS1634 family transposase [Candidatus Woesearchaeota archaeon]|nr:IS1634 family transposase [Candidatus Woesearchaeota archaeon]